MNKVITVSRQYASGGRTIGKAVAQKLGVPLYDSKIIRDTMIRTGLSAEIVESTEQRVTNSFLFNLSMGVDEAHNYMKKIQNAEYEIIQSYVKNGPCVIVGRSANFVLGDDNSLNVYIYSDINERINYAVKHYGIDEEQAKQTIKKSDRERKIHALSFYGKEWGDKNNYDLLLNSGSLGTEKCAELIVGAVR